MNNMDIPLLVFLGGGCGAVCRWSIGRLFPFDPLLGFPWATFTINVAGSFLLGTIAILCKDRAAGLALLGIGFCGGFTTFSTFSIETIRLWEADRTAAGLAYAFGSCIAALCGVALAMKLFRP